MRPSSATSRSTASRPSGWLEVTSIAGCPALITTYVEGARATPDVDTLRRLGDLLGRLHTMPPGALSRPAGVLHHWAPDGGGCDAGRAAAHRWLDAAEQRVTGDDRARLAALRARIDAADDFADLPTAVLHADFSHDNTIATPTGELVAVDWSGSGIGPRVCSVLTLLSLAVFRNPAGPDLALVDAALAGYREHVRLTTEEVDRMCGAMRHGDPVGDAFGVGVGYAQLVFVVAAWSQPNRVRDELIERVYSST